jgi:hypothetical protein
MQKLKFDKAASERVYAATTATLVQVFAPDSLPMRQGLVKYLASVPHVEATRALARLALFSPEPELREAALMALKVRREKDYTSILLMGLRYPWPEVARRAAEAVVEMERTDLLPELVALLDEPDPRLPQVKKQDGKDVYTAAHLVRVNHLRNCMLCHAAAQSVKGFVDGLTAPVPVPGNPLPPLFKYYHQSIPSESVRVDVTYLRQDFSLLQKVPDAKPWPTLQRFDYLVRTVTLTKEQAKTYETKLLAASADSPSPYRAAALAALRALTGKDAGTTAAAWRKALKLPG